MGPPSSASWGRTTLRVASYFAAPAWLGAVYLVMTGLPTWSGFAYVLFGSVLYAGLVTLPDRDVATSRRPRGVCRVASVAIALVAVVRVALTSSRAPSPSWSMRLVDGVLDEADVSLSAARVIAASGMIQDDAKELPRLTREAYADMRASLGDQASPQMATWLGLERPSAFDVIAFEPPPRNDTERAANAANAKAAVLFLHGTAGSFLMPCWRVARVARAFGALTVCPSAGFQGDWGSANGEATVRRTIDRLHARGVDRIVLVGLSAGGYGASLLGPRVRNELRGLVLVVGADPEAAAAGVPTLVIHGRADTLAPVEDARTYVANTGARYIELDDRAGHFALLARADDVDRAIYDFVRDVMF